jgi:hypothetical protein
MTFLGFWVDFGLGREAVRSDNGFDKASPLFILFRDKFINSNFTEEKCHDR